MDEFDNSSLCFATNIIPYKSKFEERAFKSIFLSFSPGFKAFGLYKLKTKRIFISRDVIFSYYIQVTDSSATTVPLPISTRNKKYQYIHKHHTKLIKSKSQAYYSTQAPSQT